MAEVNLKSLSYQELNSFLAGLGEPEYRTKQIWQWLWQKGVTSFTEMTNLSKALRDKLAERAWIGHLKIITQQESTIDRTTKCLFELPDGETVESVLMYHNYGLSVCVSTQVGCQMGCRFCASTLDGMVRNLAAWEIFDQVLRLQLLAGQRVSSVVIMGSGEPLQNYANVLGFIRLLTSPQGLHLGQRHITLSTCGLVPQIAQLAKEDLEITLSISLHATTDEVRNDLMPVNRKYPLAQLLQACRDYLQVTRRRITFEFALLAGINDSKQEAQRLAQLLKGMLCHVNLIPINPVTERGFGRPALTRVREFQQTLEGCGIETTIRRELGTDIDAACGQLRRRLAKTTNPS